MEATNGAIEHDFHNALVPINGSHSGSSGRSTPNGGDPAPGKLFVGGLSWQTSSEKLREYFGMFGTVTDVLIMKDPVTQVGLSNPEHNSRLARPINYGYYCLVVRGCLTLNFANAWLTSSLNALNISRPDRLRGEHSQNYYLLEIYYIFSGIFEGIN